MTQLMAICGRKWGDAARAVESVTDRIFLEIRRGRCRARWLPALGIVAGATPLDLSSQEVARVTANWVTDASTQSVAYASLAKAQFQRDDREGGDTLATLSTIYRAKGAFQDRSFTKAVRLLVFAVGVARTERSQNLVANEAARLAAASWEFDSSTASTFLAITEGVEQAQGELYQPMDYAIRALFRARILARVDMRDSSQQLLRNALIALQPWSTPLEPMRERLVRLAYLDLAALIDKRSKAGADSAFQLLQLAEALPISGEAGVRAAEGALRSDLFRAKGEKQSASRALVDALASMTAKDAWYSTGELPPLRLRSLPSQVGIDALYRGDTVEAARLLSASTTLTRVQTGTGLLAATVVGDNRIGRRPEQKGILLSYSYNPAGDYSPGSDDWLVITVAPPGAGARPSVQEVRITRTPGSEPSFREHAERAVCGLLKDRDKWPAYLRGNCQAYLGEGAIDADRFLKLLADTLLPSATVRKLLETMPRGTVLELNLPKELLPIPFANLPFRDTALGEYFTIVHVTSAEVDTETGAPPEKSLVILKRNSTQGQLNRGNRSIEISFVGLPDATIARAMQIAELMHADTITESRPQEEQIKAASAQYTDIHFATHGRFAPDFLEGVLAVQEDPTRGEDDSPGLLDAQEIHLLQWRRGAIITLAACESALTNGSAEVYESVGGAFLLRGVVAAVVGTAWQVDAPSASLFMREFYLERSKGRSEFESFRSGVDTVRAKGWIDWAAFTLLRKHTY